MKKVFLTAVLTLGLMGVTNAEEVDVLALVTKGKVSDNSAGVKVLNIKEEQEVVGGYRPYTLGWNYYINTMPFTNSYNANSRPQSNQHMVNAFMRCYVSKRC